MSIKENTNEAVLFEKKCKKMYVIKRSILKVVIIGLIRI